MASYTWPPTEAASGSGIVSINGDSSTTQTLTTGTAGTDFAIVDGGGGAHTFNLPDAGSSARGVVSTGTQTFAGAKTFSTSVQSPANYHLDASENNSGNSGTTKTIDWSAASAQLSTLTGSVTYTFTNAVAGGAYVLRISTGAGSFTVTWPGSVLWPGGSAPTVTATASKVDVFNFYYDGTNFYGTFAQNY